MIVSGFTQKRGYQGEPPPDMDGQHSHCIRCCQVACSKFADQVTACEMTTCELCGWRCHKCKQAEHALHCPEERVACLNKEYGCPHMVKRLRMASHLPVCPASVVCCSEEWSRWPMHAREKGVRMPLPQTKTYIDCGQLDVGLAMRDQRMLIDSLRAPRKLRRTLRNALTQKYPAAPFTPHSRSHESDIAASSDTSHTVSDDESDAPWDLTKSPPGLRESIKSKLFLVTKETTDNVAAALEKSAMTLSPSQDRLTDMTRTNDDSSLTTQNTPEGTSELNFRSSSLPPNHTFNHSNSGSDLSTPHQAYHIQSTSVETEGNAQPPFSSEENSTTMQSLKSSDTNVPTSPTTGNQQRSGEPVLGIPTASAERSSHSMERSIRSSVSSDRVSEANARSRSTLQDMGGTQLHKLLAYSEGGGGGGDNGEAASGSGPGQDPTTAASEICLHQLLGVNIGFECINKYVQKSPSMYTFICSQNFRRDQYRWHFKNVHQEIHQGMHGWLEQRCPLAYLGCTFCFSRLEPAQAQTQVYHSWLQESFGLRSTAMWEQERRPGPSAAGNITDSIEISGSSQGNPSGEKKAPGSDDKPTEPNSCHLEGNHPDAGPSISDLAIADRDFDQPSRAGVDAGGTLNDDKGGKTADCRVSTGERIGGSGVGSLNRTDAGKTEGPRSRSQSSEMGTGPRLPRMRVRPTILTAMNWDSKVLFEYEVEEEEEESAGVSILDLPFELLRRIAKHLDSFSLCNLALTSRLLRDVCSSLLEDHGIVVLNWQRTGDGFTWKVVNRRWMFSTSFEPIKSWRFKQNVPHMGDHLKVCAFNQDILRHTGRIQIMSDGKDLEPVSAVLVQA